MSALSPSQQPTVLYLFPALHAFWFLEKTALRENRVSGTVLKIQLTWNSPTNSYISQKLHNWTLLMWKPRYVETRCTLYFHWRYLQCKLWGAISVRDKVSLSWWHKSKATRLLQPPAQLPAFTLLRTQSEDFHKKQPN